MRMFFVAMGLILAASPALAHHAMGGVLPSTMLQGLLSGLAHPIIGLDHFAFIAAAGVLAGLAGRPLTAPLGLVAGALAGAVLHLGAINLPGSEALVALSVIVAGAAVFFGVAQGVGILIAGFALAGVVHGYAYAESIVGAEQGVVAAYLASFSAIQWGLAVLAGLAAKVLAGAGAWARTRRLAGGALAALGLTFLVQAVL